MSYYTAAGEPPGQWAGKGAAALGLSGQVDPAVIGRLYQHNIGPGGELLVKRRQSKTAAETREAAAVAAYQAAHPYASATELAEVRAAERGKDPHQVPYFDLTVSAAKSVSVLHASYRVSARHARERGDQDQAAVLDARADELEDALMDAAREAVGLAGPARGLHPDRAPFGPHGGVAGRRRAGRQLVPAPPVPGRRPAAARARGDLEPGPARRRRRRQVADAGLPHPAQPAARRRPGRRPDPGDQADRARLRHGAPGRRQRRRDRRGPPGRDGPVQLPRRRGHRRSRTGSPASTRRCTASRRLGGRCGCCTSRPGRTPAAPRAQARRTLAGQTGATEPTEAQRLAAWEAQTARREMQALSAVHEQVARFAAGARRRCTGGAGRCGQAHGRADRGGRGANAITRSGRWRSSGSRCTGRCRC